MISGVVLEVLYYKPLQNLKEYKRYLRRPKTDATFMQKGLITSNGHIFFFTILCIIFSVLDRLLVSLEHLTSKKCYLCKNQVKGEEKVSNINAAGIDTITICVEKQETRKHRIKNFHLVSNKVKNVSCESLKNNKLICHSQRRRDFTNDVKISRLVISQKLSWVCNSDKHYITMPKLKLEEYLKII